MNLDGCNAVITGASAGIGREIARELAGRARQLVLVARRKDRLEELRLELTAKHPSLDVQTRAVDLATRNDLRRLTDWLGMAEIRIDLLVNNAGLGDLGAFANAQPERLEAMVLVNIDALTLLTRAVLPQMIANRRGAILNVSSSASFLPIAGFAVYAASKAYVTSFSEALRAELRSSGISVTALCPGPVHTEFTEVACRPGTWSAPAPDFVHVSAERVARLGLRGLEHNRPIVIPGVVMKVAMFVTRMTPMPLLRLASRVSAKRLGE